MNLHGKEIKVFTGNSNIALSEEIAEIIGLPLGKAVVKKFSDGECCINIGEGVRGCDIFLIQSTCPPVNDNVMELLIMIDALKRASAGRITAVMPYFGYARQDRKAKSRDPISAKLLANIITVAGADRILTMDLHASQIQGFFDIPVDHLEGGNILSRYIRKSFENFDELVVLAPDVGSVNRSRKVAERLGLPIAIVDKRRQKANECEIMNVVGDIKGKTCLIVDDLIDTAGTICKGAQVIKEMGAKEIYAFCTHALLSGEAITRLEASPIKELVVLNTIPLDGKQSKMINMLSVAPLFAEAIERIYSDISISALFAE
jgi:ribose-phosphate pyrophosphokinase